MDKECSDDGPEVESGWIYWRLHRKRFPEQMVCEFGIIPRLYEEILAEKSALAPLFHIKSDYSDGFIPEILRYDAGTHEGNLFVLVLVAWAQPATAHQQRSLPRQTSLIISSMSWVSSPPRVVQAWYMTL